MPTPKTFPIRYCGSNYKIGITVRTYVQGGRAVSLEMFDSEDGESFAVLSTWLPQTCLLKPDEFFVKDWSENSPVVEQMVKLKLIERINHAPVSAGHIEQVFAYKLTAAAEEFTTYEPEH